GGDHRAAAVGAADHVLALSRAAVRRGAAPRAVHDPAGGLRRLPAGRAGAAPVAAAGCPALRRRRRLSHARRAGLPPRPAPLRVGKPLQHLRLTRPPAARMLGRSQSRTREDTVLERYTEKARRLLTFARYEARQRGDKPIAGEHLLLALLREPEIEALAATRNVSLANIRDE